MNFKKVKLGDVCRIEKGITGILKAIPGQYPLVVTGEDRKSHNEFQFDEEAVIIPLVSGTGHGHASIKRIHYQKGKFALGSILCAVVPKNNMQLNAEFLYHFLDLNKEYELVARMKGMANVTLPLKEIAQVEIPLPPLQEQLKFVERYKYLENHSNGLSTELTHQLDLVKKLRQQLLQDAVQGKLVPQNPNDEPATELLKKIKKEKEQLIKAKKYKKDKVIPEVIKQEEIPFAIPDNWVWCRLGELFWVTKLAGFEYTEHIKLKPSGDIPVVRAQNVKPNKLVEDNLLYIDKETSFLLDRCALVKKSLLITFIGAGIGEVAIFDKKERWHLAPNVAKAEPYFQSLSIEYIMWFLLSGFGMDEFMKISKATAQPSLSMGTIREVCIPLPPINEQQLIVQKLEELMLNCDKLEKSIQNSQAQNEKLLQQVLREALQPK